MLIIANDLSFERPLIIRILIFLLLFWSVCRFYLDETIFTSEIVIKICNLSFNWISARSFLWFRLIITSSAIKIWIRFTITTFIFLVNIKVGWNLDISFFFAIDISNSFDLQAFRDFYYLPTVFIWVKYAWLFCRSLTIEYFKVTNLVCIIKGVWLASSRSPLRIIGVIPIHALKP